MNKLNEFCQVNRKRHYHCHNDATCDGDLGVMNEHVHQLAQKGKGSRAVGRTDLCWCSKRTQGAWKDQVKEDRNKNNFVYHLHGLLVP